MANWLDEAADDYEKPVSLSTFMDRVLLRLDEPGADVRPALKVLEQHNVDGSDPALHEAFSI